MISNVRCRAPGFQGRCNRKLAESVTAPFQLRCTRCKAMTSVGADLKGEVTTTDGKLILFTLDNPEVDNRDSD